MTELPEDISADYVNEGAEEALKRLLSDASFENLAALLQKLRDGYLVADVTGGSSRKKGTRIRTIRSTKGQLVLPLFTSMEKLRAASGSGGRKNADVKGALMPALEALRLIESDRFVALELNSGGGESLVILRKYVSLALDTQEITPDRLNNLR